MHLLLRPALCLALLATAACDEVAMVDDPVARADTRGQKSCLNAVADKTGVEGVSINTSIPVIEINYFIVNVPNGKTWGCKTNDEGSAIEIVQRRA